MKKKHAVHSAISGALAMSVLTLSAASYAADDHSQEEQCAGVIKAGNNDCATKMNECRGHVTQDSNPMAWIYVPKGTCEKIAGAHRVTVKDPSQKN